MDKRISDIDRGWAWVVMASVYLGMSFFCTAMYMNGVLYVALLDKFKEGEAKTALTGAISIGLQCFAPLLGGVINNKFSCRVTIILGGIFTTVGFASSAFVNSLNALIVTSGVCVGTGYGLSASGLICVLGFYFEKWRNVVISLAFLAVGVAMFISSPLGLLLINTYGLTATYLIVACIEAQLCVFGMLCKPSSIERKVHRQKKIDEKRETKTNTKTLFDFTLLRNKSYILFLISSASWTFALSSAVIHLPNYVSVLGGTSRDIGLMMTSFSVANVFGRLCGAATVYKMVDKSIFVYMTVLALTGVITSLFMTYSKWTAGAYVFAIQLGIFTGWPNAMMTPISLSFVGVAKLSEAYGLVSTFCGVGVTAGPVLIGGILLIGSLCGLGSICCRPPMKKDQINLEVIAGNSTQDLEKSNEEHTLKDYNLDKGMSVDDQTDIETVETEDLLMKTHT